MSEYETFILRACEPSGRQEAFSLQPPLSDRFLFTVLKANASLFCTVNVHQITTQTSQRWTESPTWLLRPCVLG